MTFDWKTTAAIAYGFSIGWLGGMVFYAWMS